MEVDVEQVLSFEPGRRGVDKVVEGAGILYWTASHLKLAPFYLLGVGLAHVMNYSV